MASHRICARIAFQTAFHVARLFRGRGEEGVSILLITWNRARFLSEALRALAETVPKRHEVLLWDNNSKDGTADVIAQWRNSRLALRVFRSPRNIGTAAYAKLALQARYRWLVELDDDILALPAGWSARMTEAFAAFPELGYLCLDVVQDEFTNGAKPLPEHYRSETRGGVTVEFGPAGGWAAMVPREFYFRAGGFPFRPHKPFFSEDGWFNMRTRMLGKQSGVLAGVKAYHATGPAWNAAFGYLKLTEEKLASPGAATNSGLTYAATGNRLPDLSVLAPYRQHNPEAVQP